MSMESLPQLFIYFADNLVKLTGRIHQEILDVSCLPSKDKNMTLKDRQFEKIILNGWNLFKDILITGRQNVIDQKMDEFLTTCVKGTDDCLFKLVEESEWIKLFAHMDL